MRNPKATIVAALFAMTLPVHAAEPTGSDLQELSKLLKKGSTPNVRLEEDEKKRAETLLVTILPDQKFIGDDKEWKVGYHDMDQGDFLQVDLKKKGEESSDKLIWFHIVYQQEKPKFYGSENFGKYKGMGAKDVHYFILVGNVEIRAAAASDEYRNDKKIKGILKAFRLRDIEKL